VRLDVACTRLLPLVLSGALAMGCTSKLINLAVHDGGTDAGSGDPDIADRPGPADLGIELALDDAGTDDTVAVGDGPDGASAADFQRAYDAGMVTEAGHYVQFTCCDLADPNKCADEWIGGPDTCLGPAEWKARSSVRCDSLGLVLTAYGLFGACATTGTL